MKLYRIINTQGQTIRSRGTNGYYDTKDSAVRALRQFDYRYGRVTLTIEETEVTWSVSD